MNIIVGLVVLVIAVTTLKHDEIPEKPAAPDESGKLIRDYMEWEYSWAMDPSSNQQPHDPPDCGQGKIPRTWFLDGINPRKPYERECSVPLGTTMIFPITYLHASLNARNPEECETAISKIKTELVSTTGELSVIVDGKELDPSSYWRNNTNECFPLKTELTQWVEKRDWDIPIWGNTYVDGYWLTLKFETHGSHKVSIRELPKSSGLQPNNVPYTTYTIHVGQ